MGSGGSGVGEGRYSLTNVQPIRCPVMSMYSPSVGEGGSTLYTVHSDTLNTYKVCACLILVNGAT